jgi:hypothetical protein
MIVNVPLGSNAFYVIECRENYDQYHYPEQFGKTKCRAKWQYKNIRQLASQRFEEDDEFF